MKKTFSLFLAVIGAIALLAAPGPAASDLFVFPSPPDRNSLGNLSGAYREFTFSMNDLLCAGGIGNAVYLKTKGHIEYTPAYNTQPGWVNPGIDWPGGQHTYVINLPSPTGGQAPYIPGFHPINGLGGTDVIPGGIGGLVVLLYDINVDLPDNAEEFLSPDFLSNVNAIVAFSVFHSTALIFEKTPVPEPLTLLLLGGALIVLGVIRWKFRK